MTFEKGISPYDHDIRSTLNSLGFQAITISRVPEGRSHDNLRIDTSEGQPFIARFKKETSTTDTYFNGHLSLEREMAVMNLIKEETDLPVPKVYGLYGGLQMPFLLVECLPGVYWSKYLQRNNYSLDAYLKSLRFLGKDLARLHRITFDSYGDVMGKDNVHPGTIHNFADRLQMIIDLKIQRAQTSNALQGQELDIVVNYLQTGLADLGGFLAAKPQTPILTLTDMHPMNFLVDDQGKPSGYFDLEFCQAAIPALEIYFLRYHLLNFFRNNQQAEASFMSGYEEEGGKYDSQDPVNKGVEEILTIGHLLDAVSAYYGVFDGLRDKWSQQFKKVLFDAVNGGGINYQAITDITRNKTGHPIYATR